MKTVAMTKKTEEKRATIKIPTAERAPRTADVVGAVGAVGAVVVVDLLFVVCFVVAVSYHVRRHPFRLWSTRSSGSQKYSIGVTVLRCRC
jgi:hypothetical protein